MQFERFEKAITDALTELEGARNVAMKADASLFLKEVLVASNMYADFNIKQEQIKSWVLKNNEQKTE